MNNQEYTPALLRSKRALLGSFVHSVSFGEIEMIENGLMIYLVNGTIEALLDLDTTPFDRSLLAHLDVTDYTGKIIMPGFVDAHVHAPQYVFSGTGMDLPLLAWLEKYTFPAEARFSDTDFARLAYSRSIKRHLKCGTTFASYFATIHQPAGKVLVDVLQAVGQRAFVGKVSMDRNSPDFYIEQTQKGCSDAEEFARYVLGHLLNLPCCPLVMPCVTPRFVPTCTGEMMGSLGRLGAKYGLPVQSHLSESRGEIQWVKELHPGKCCRCSVMY
ncbi:hypothetical protein B484DRAFT_335729 [Ochromonadaceae sp. CCMP2298]|nr:hypothetical protein B484DRAFT_335729 [Ochromonadaceae sp. CCMP2298]